MSCDAKRLWNQPPGPCPFRANSTRCSGVKSRNTWDGLGGRSFLSGLGSSVERVVEPACEALDEEAALFRSASGPRGVLDPILVLVLGSVCVRQPDHANHKPPTASSAAVAS